jgi:hypothetical protein
LTHWPPHSTAVPLQMMSHAVPSQVAVAPGGAAQGVQLAPQLAVLLLLTHAPPQSW